MSASEFKAAWWAELEKWKKQLAIHELTEQLETAVRSSKTAQAKLKKLEKDLEQKELLISKLLTSDKKETPSSNSRLLGKLVAEYYREKKSEWVERTAVQNKSNLLRFAEIIGVLLQSESITGKDIDRYVSVLSRLPKNVKNLSSGSKPANSVEAQKYWADLAENHTGERLRANGLDKHFTSIKPFLTWCHRRHHIDRDYSSYLKVSQKRKTNEGIQVVPFTVEQLELANSDNKCTTHG